MVAGGGGDRFTPVRLLYPFLFNDRSAIMALAENGRCKQNLVLFGGYQWTYRHCRSVVSYFLEEEDYSLGVKVDRFAVPFIFCPGAF